MFLTKVCSYITYRNGQSESEKVLRASFHTCVLSGSKMNFTWKFDSFACFWPLLWLFKFTANPTKNGYGFWRHVECSLTKHEHFKWCFLTFHSLHCGACSHFGVKFYIYEWNPWRVFVLSCGTSLSYFLVFGHFIVFTVTLVHATHMTR